MAKRKELKTRRPTVFVNDDLTPTEKKSRHALVPLYKALRTADVRCRLDRACLIVSGAKFFDPKSAIKALTPSPNPAIQRSLASLRDQGEALPTNPLTTGTTPSQGSPTTPATTPQQGFPSRGSHWLSISHLNCQGLLSKLDYLSDKLVCDWESDVVCLSETWLRPHSTTDSHLAIPDFSFFRRDRPERSQGGLLVYCMLGTTSGWLVTQSWKTLSASLSNSPLRTFSSVATDPQTKTQPFFLNLSHTYQEYIRTRVCNSILWGLSRQNSKFVIDDAQPLSFQVVMHSTLNTCMLALSRSSIFLTGISG